MSEPEFEKLLRFRDWTNIEGAITTALDALRPLVPEHDTWEDISDLLREAVRLGYAAGRHDGAANARLFYESWLRARGLLPPEPPGADTPAAG